MNQISFKTIVSLILILLVFSCGLTDSDEGSLGEFVYKGETESYKASNEGKLIIIGGAVLEDYEEVTFDLQINYDDGSPASNAKVIYEERPDFVILQIVSDADEGGSAMIVGTPLEIKDMLENAATFRNKQFPSLDDHRVESLVGIIVGGVIIIKEAAKLYSVYRTGQAIWNTGLEVYEVSTFFVSDAIRYEAGAMLYCKELNDLESLAQSLQYIARTTPRLVISLKGEFGENAFEVIAGDVGGRLEDYLADFVIDKTFRFYEDVYDLDEKRFGLRVHPMGFNLFPTSQGERVGFIEIIPELAECQLIDYPHNGIPGEGVTDIDGNEYRTVIIGNQEWMAENLRVTRYRNGQVISTGLSNTQWENISSGAFAVYPYQSVIGLNNHEEVVEAYGLLYNWHSVDDSRGLCPGGWRVPTDPEWQQLIDHLTDVYGFHNNPLSNDIHGVGNKLRSRRQTNSPLGEPWATNLHPRWELELGTHFGTDDFGFSGLPSGVRDIDGTFGAIGYLTFWWSSSLSAGYSFVWGQMQGSGAMIRGVSPHNYGSSVRCIKD